MQETALRHVWVHFRMMWKELTIGEDRCNSLKEGYHHMYMSCCSRCTCRAVRDVHVERYEMYMSCGDRHRGTIRTPITLS